MNNLSSRFQFCCLSAVFLTVMAVPAAAVPARHVSRLLTLTDGTTVTACLQGDEFQHYWLSEDGRIFTEQDDGRFATLSDETLSRGRQRRMIANGYRRSQRSLPQRRLAFSGEKRGLVIMMNFTNKKFSTTREQWDAMLNQDGYSLHGAPGCVREYFSDQSSALFRLDFDIYGPFEADTTYAYYGANDSNGDDANIGDLVVEAVDAIKDSVDLTQYDWDDDGFIDQVFILYAGYGEASGASSNTIWPHEYWLQWANVDKWYDSQGYEVQKGLKVNQYACSCELSGTRGTVINGMATFVHEFSHCFGLPDFYSTSSSTSTHTAWGWDVLDYGVYNNDGWAPPCYNGYERNFCGWLSFLLFNNDETVPALKPITRAGDVYLIMNDGDDDEYYFFENRQKEKWDIGLPGHGLLIFHVDYDEEAWYDNVPNDNDNHPRMAPISASNRYGYYSSANYAYPYKGNDSLTDNSTPSFKWYNNDSRGLTMAGMKITDITEQADSTVSFSFVSRATVIAVPTVGTDRARRKEDNAVYDLSGRCVSLPRGGIYIKNGKLTTENKQQKR